MFGVGSVVDGFLLLLAFAALGALFVIGLVLTLILKAFRLPFSHAFAFGFGIPAVALLLVAGTVYVTSESAPQPKPVQLEVSLPTESSQ